MIIISVMSAIRSYVCIRLVTCLLNLIILDPYWSRHSSLSCHPLCRLLCRPLIQLVDDIVSRIDSKSIVCQLQLIPDERIPSSTRISSILLRWIDLFDVQWRSLLRVLLKLIVWLSCDRFYSVVFLFARSLYELPVTLRCLLITSKDIAHIAIPFPWWKSFLLSSNFLFLQSFDQCPGFLQ